MRPASLCSSPTHISTSPSCNTDQLSYSDSQFLRWKVAFRVRFHSEKLGLRFHPAQIPDTGNGVYAVRLLEISQTENESNGPAQLYNQSLESGQEHLKLRSGLYLTHVNDVDLHSISSENAIQCIQKARRPVTLRFVDVEAGVVTANEIRRDSLEHDACLSKAYSSSSSPNGRSNNFSTATVTESISNSGSSNYNNRVYKIILLGTTGVGKSSLLAVGVNGDSAYDEKRPATLQAEFGSIEIPDPDMSNPKTIKARLWDTAGQERYRAITQSHYRKADGALLVYDVADVDSFEKLGGWLNALRETAGDSLKSIMVIENKVDKLPDIESRKLQGERGARFVNHELVMQFCKDNNLLFARATAKHNQKAYKWNGQKISDIFSHLILNIHATALARESNSPRQKHPENKVVHLISSTNNEYGSPHSAQSSCSGCSS